VRNRTLLQLAASLALAGPGAASAAAQLVAPTPRVQTAVEALAQDAAEYARLNGVGLAEAMRRLRAQEESVAATERLQTLYRDRLAGISIEHHPDYRIAVLLTGAEPVADQTIVAGDLTVPVVFRTGAAATRDQIVAAMTQHQAAIRRLVPRGRGMGVDPRTGELVMLLWSGDHRSGLESELEALTGVPVRLRLLDGADADLAVEGGSRVEGVDPGDGRRYYCTTGFVVTDRARTGIVTAAHCPDTLSYRDPEGADIPLDFVGQWGARYQDVQVHVSERAQQPLFHADKSRGAVRRLTSWRNRTSTRAGDAVCHRGESTGYSCSQVELTDFAPPGDLCGGPCDPTWVTVTGPTCRGGDSGGPIFNGTIAFGIVKGGNYSRSGRCNFYYYMSTDFLPEGWSLLY
jgi:streptogrisin C